MKIFVWKNPGQATFYYMRGFVNALEYIGCEVKTYSGIINDWYEFDPDIYIGHNDNSYHQNIPDKNKRGNCKLVLGICRGSEFKETNKKYTEMIVPDVIFFHGFDKPNDIIYWKYWIDKYPSMYSIMGGDTLLYDKKKGLQNIFDFGYVGGYWTYKAISIDKLLIPILKYYKNYKIYGNGNQGWPNNISHGTIEGEEEAKFLASCKILPCVNEPHIQQYGIDVAERIYKASLSGGLILHDNVKDIHKILPSVITYNSSEDLKNKIDYYLDHEDERIKIAEEQRQFILKNHTYFHRIKKMFEVLKMEKEVEKCNQYIKLNL